MELLADEFKVSSFHLGQQCKLGGAQCNIVARGRGEKELQEGSDVQRHCGGSGSVGGTGGGDA